MSAELSPKETRRREAFKRGRILRSEMSYNDQALIAQGRRLARDAEEDASDGGVRWKLRVALCRLPVYYLKIHSLPYHFNKSKPSASIRADFTREDLKKRISVIKQGIRSGDIHWQRADSPEIFMHLDNRRVRPIDVKIYAGYLFNRRQFRGLLKLYRAALRRVGRGS